MLNKQKMIKKLENLTVNHPFIFLFMISTSIPLIIPLFSLRKLIRITETFPYFPELLKQTLRVTNDIPWLLIALD